MGKQLRAINIRYMLYNKKKDIFTQKITKFCKRTVSQPESANYPIKTINVFGYAFLSPLSLSQLNLSSIGSVNNVITRQRNKMNKKSAIMLKKIETRSVKTKNPLFKYKTVTDINLLTNRKWVYAGFY